MATAKLRKVGGSVMLAIPPSFLEELSVGIDSMLDLTLRGQELVLRPARRKYTLDDLLSDADPNAPFSDEERAWFDDAPTGREMI